MYRCKTKLFLSFLGIVCLFLPALAYAAPSMSGSTGMIRIPAADVLRSGHLSAGYYGWQDNGVAVVGAGLIKGMEISAAAPWRKLGSDSWQMNVKWNLNQEALLYPAVAIGVEDVAGVERRSYYGVISKTLPYGFRLHLGAGGGRFDGVFFAVEKVLNPTSLRKRHRGFPVTTVIVEMDGAKMNYGARLALARGVRLDCGWLGREHRYFWGVSYTY